MNMELLTQEEEEEEEEESVLDSPPPLVLPKTLPHGSDYLPQLNLSPQESDNEGMMDHIDHRTSVQTGSMLSDDHINSSDYSNEDAVKEEDRINSPPDHESSEEEEKSSRQVIVESEDIPALGRFKFVGETERELPFEKGDIIILVSTKDVDWYYGYRQEEPEKLGFMPSTYVKKLQEGLYERDEKGYVKLKK